MQNLLAAERGDADELASLRREAQDVGEEAKDKTAKKVKKDSQKEKDKKKEKKRARSSSPLTGRKAGRDLNVVLGGSGLDPDPKRRKKMMKKAKRIVKRKKKKKGSSSSSSGSQSKTSRSSSSTQEVEAADIFGQRRMAKRVSSRCPGVLTATSLAAVQEQLLTTQGQLWELDRRELPPLFLQYFRGQLQQRMQPAMRREAIHVSYCLDLGLMGRIPQLLDVLSQRLKALEGQTSGKHWSVTAQYELVPGTRLRCLSARDGTSSERGTGSGKSAISGRPPIRGSSRRR